jgi:hypothetical protein
MKDVRFVARADDAGSNVSANEAFLKVIRGGFIKNVSLMAVGPQIEDAQRLLKFKGKVCFGMHAVLNAEWDRVKWGPLSGIGAESGLLDPQGYFLSHPSMFEKTKPPVEVILREYEAQLDKLTRLHFPVQYVDSHMLPEKYVPGLLEATSAWIKRKGLIDHAYFYTLPPGLEKIAQDPKQLIPVLKAVPEGQYFFAIHPALDSEEMRATGNAEFRGEDIARGRSGEAKMFSRKTTGWLLRSLGIRPIRYDEAVPGELLDPAMIP